MAHEALLAAARRSNVPVTMAVVLTSLVCAKDTLIDARTPYASGVVAAPVASGGFRQGDTVSFSTGLGLMYVQLCGAMCDELSAQATGYVRVRYGSVGMRWVPGMQLGGGCTTGGAVVYSPVHDTLWHTSFTFPDSLAAVDTAGRDAPWLSGCSTGLVVKEWTCYQIGYCPPMCAPSWVPSWHFITYARCPNGSHMAFQFAVDTTFVGGNWNGWVVRWAVDSAGNGVFKVGATGVPQDRERRGAMAAPSHFARGKATCWRTYDLVGRALDHGRSETSSLLRRGVQVTPVPRVLHFVVQ